MVRVLPLVLAVGHDVQQRLERRAGVVDGAVGEVRLRHPLLRLDDVVHAVGEHGRVLRLGLSISSANTAVGLSNTRPKKVWTNLAVMR